MTTNDEEIRVNPSKKKPKNNSSDWPLLMKVN